MDIPERTLALISIFKSFGGRPILRGVSAEAMAGQVTALVGRNGAGKTTLLEIASGLVTPDHGVVNYFGELLMRPRLPRLARRGLFYLPTALGLPQRSRVVDLLRTASCGDIGVARETAAALGVESCFQARISVLSAGQRRRVEIALAVARAPKCLLADEPFRALEPIATGMVARALHSLSSSGSVVLVTGHELDALLPVTDRVILLAQGHACSLGSPEAAIRDSRLRRVYLGAEDLTLRFPSPFSPGPSQ